jgi:general nucleoside transport system ATP-binding protein
MTAKVPYISMNGIGKSFGKVTANKNVNLTINGGEIHALLGENGAGKSTLMNMLSGVYTPDSGSIFIHGKKLEFKSPKDAIKAGIGMIYQHFKLVENMTALENITLGQHILGGSNRKKVVEKISSISERYSLNVDLNKYVYDMSVGERQVLEILKVLFRGADILILDEPTTVFTPQESEKLFKIMFKMKEEGCALIFISHKMDEVMAVSDRITVLRKGETIKTVNKDDTSPKELTELMVGRPVELAIKKSPQTSNEEVLVVNNLKVLDDKGIEIIRDLSFNIKKGEVFGVAGIAGGGQKELCEAIAGIQPVKAGEIIFEGENIVGKSPKDIITKGISMSFVPEDRLGMGLVGSMDMVDNILLKGYQSQKGFFINRKPAEEKAKELMDKLQIKTPSIHHAIKYLSGGNIQKILLGRELSLKPRLLIMAYPVRGLDINTCYTIYDLINKEKERGNSVLFIGEDLDVIMELCDRIMVICAGETTGVVDSKDITKEQLGMLMVGKKEVVKEGADA